VTRDAIFVPGWVKHVRVEKQRCQNGRILGTGRVIEDLELVRCEFIASHIAQFDDPELGLVVRNVSATKCVAKRSGAAGVRFEDVLVDGLDCTVTRLEGCVFSRVTLRGRIGQLICMPPNPAMPTEIQDAFRDGIVRAYAGVDWALDISEAQFTGAGLYYVPGDLVRRNPDTQYLIRRSVVAGVDLSDLPLRAQIAASRLESTPFDSLVAVAPTRAKDFAEVKAAFDEMRARGLAE
jgi:hypothetical protein